MDQKEKQEYQEYVKEITPTHSFSKQLIHAFICGGIISLLGQAITNYLISMMDISKKDAGAWCSLLLILLSVILTALHLYGRLVKWGGAGALVPITGFANSVASSAIEFKKEGWVFGVGCKIFTIAGPVILYGIFVSWVLGLIYWIGNIIG